MEEDVSQTALKNDGARIASGRRTAAHSVSNFVAVYGLLVVLLLIFLVFGILRPTSFLSIRNINGILVSESVTAMLALAVMVPLATKQFDLSIGYHLGMAQVLAIGLQVNQGLSWEAAAVIVLVLSLAAGGGLSISEGLAQAPDLFGPTSAFPDDFVQNLAREYFKQNYTADESAYGAPDQVTLNRPSGSQT